MKFLFVIDPIKNINPLKDSTAALMQASSKKNIEILGKFSSIGMGGVSRLSQLYTLKLLDPKRVKIARSAVPSFYSKQRIRYKNAFNDLTLETHSGDGGFYHWCKLPNQISSSTGIPTPFKVEFAFNCFDGYLLEADVHKELKSFRVNNGREFFSIDLKAAKEKIEELGKKYTK